MTTKDKVLQLLKESPDFLSGEKMAQQLQVSRTSIWKAIKELEKQVIILSIKLRGTVIFLLMC